MRVNRGSLKLPIIVGILLLSFVLCVSSHPTYELQGFDLEAAEAQPRPVFSKELPAQSLPLIYEAPLSDASEKVEKILLTPLAFSYNNHKSDSYPDETIVEYYGQERLANIEREDKDEGAGNNEEIVSKDDVKDSHQDQEEEDEELEPVKETLDEVDDYNQENRNKDEERNAPPVKDSHYHKSAYSYEEKNKNDEPAVSKDYQEPAYDFTIHDHENTRKETQKSKHEELAPLKESNYYDYTIHNHKPKNEEKQKSEDYDYSAPLHETTKNPESEASHSHENVKEDTSESKTELLHGPVEQNHGGGGSSHLQNVHESHHGTDSVASHTHKKKHKKGHKHHGGDGKFEKGGGKEHKAEHHSEHGEKGEKGYKGHHSHDKGEHGHHKKEDHKGKYKEKGGSEKKHHGEKGHYGHHDKGEKGEKGHEYHEDGKHSKGHSTKGEHNIHKKDEFEKKHEFYDEHHEGGEHEKHGGFHHEDHYEKGDKGKHGHKKEGHHEDHYGKKEHHKKGHHYHEDKGHKKEDENKHHHDHEHKHGEKGGKSEAKKWGHKKSSGGGGGGGGGHKHTDHKGHASQRYSVREKGNPGAGGNEHQPPPLPRRPAKGKPIKPKHDPKDDEHKKDGGSKDDGHGSEDELEDEYEEELEENEQQENVRIGKIVRPEDFGPGTNKYYGHGTSRKGGFAKRTRQKVSGDENDNDNRYHARYRAASPERLVFHNKLRRPQSDSQVKEESVTDASEYNIEEAREILAKVAPSPSLQKIIYEEEQENLRNYALNQKAANSTGITTPSPSPLLNANHNLLPVLPFIPTQIPVLKNNNFPILPPTTSYGHIVDPNNLLPIIPVAPTQKPVNTNILPIIVPDEDE